MGAERDADPLPAPDEKPWPVHAGDGVVGRVTSCVYSPRLGKNIGLAMVGIAQTEVGIRLSTTSPQGDVAAVVVPMPFLPHRLK